MIYNKNYKALAKLKNSYSFAGGTFFVDHANSPKKTQTQEKNTNTGGKIEMKETEKDTFDYEGHLKHCKAMIADRKKREAAADVEEGIKKVKQAMHSPLASGIEATAEKENRTVNGNCPSGIFQRY